ncbi:unnamed protein product, partial [Adineta ricciae]
GDENDTHIRTLADPHRRVLQRGGVDAFLMSVPKSLGQLNCIRIWHDNSGKGSSSSWFLKYIIIRDLQTMQTFHFISQRWFAVEKDDGKIERVLHAASDMEKSQFSFVLTKRTYHSVSDGHLWFSIFSRPPSSQFTRVQRCTCCFVLLLVSMFLNIMYYDLSNEVKSRNTTSLSFGTVHFSSQQIIIGIVVEMFALIPSLLLVQLFRRVRPRRQQQSPLRQALSKVKLNVQNDPNRQKNSKKKKNTLMFPWWCILIAYGLCLVLVGVSILFIIARGIEFGDAKTQKWLVSVVSGIFSSVLLTQPLKIIALAIFFACFFRKSTSETEPAGLLGDDQVDLAADEEYLHTFQKKSLFVHPSSIRAQRLSDHQISQLRDDRLKEIQIRNVIREMVLYVCFLVVLCAVIYSNRDSSAYYQVDHLRKYLLDSRQENLDFTKIATIDEYWNWLEKSLIINLRAQQWYNGDPPRSLTGFIDDKSNRLIGWATMRQLRVKAELCRQQNVFSLTCAADYSLRNEDKQSYAPAWQNQSSQIYHSSVTKAFTYQSGDVLDTYVYVGDHASYASGGYVYEFRGRLSDLQSNLSQLHQLGWIDNQTRAVIIQMTLYNPNVALFTAVTFLAEFLSSGGVFSSARFEPISFYAFTSTLQLVCTIVYMLFICYFMWLEVRLLIEMKWKYFNQFWSYVDAGIIACSWASVGIYIWRLGESRRIGKLFEKTNGYVYINLQLASFINNALTDLLSFCCFFGTIQLIKLCRINRKLILFIRTLQCAAKELLSFSFVFSFVFLSFLCLFYLLFVSKLPECSSLLGTAQMLFEMTLMKFDAHELSGAAAFLGPFCFSLFIFMVVFICLSMFVSIINDNFRRARENVDDRKEDLLALIIERFKRWSRLKRFTEEDWLAERDAQMRGNYYDPIEKFPDRIDQLFVALDKIHADQK